LRLRARQLQTLRDRLLRQFARTAPVHPTPDELRLLHRRNQLAVLQDRAGGITQNAADSQNDHLPPFVCFSIFAHASFSPTVRLKTGLPGAESGSTTK